VEVSLLNEKKPLIRKKPMSIDNFVSRIKEKLEYANSSKKILSQRLSIYCNKVTNESRIMDIKT
jgi:hypothetical protein